MNKRLSMLFFLQIKAALLLLPRLLLILIISALLGSGIYAAGTELLSPDSCIRLPAALILPENDTYAGIAFSFLEHMDSIKSTCTFQRTTKEDGLTMLKNGEVYAVILIPDSFVENILNGRNTPATLLLPREGSLESFLFLTLADSGASTLAAAQAGIYAMDELLIDCGHTNDIAQAEKALNDRYLSYARNRNKLFTAKKLSATGNLSVTEYFLCSGIVLFLLLSGMGSYDYFRGETAGLRLLLHRQGIHAIHLALLRIFALTLVYTVFLFPLGSITGLMPYSGILPFFLLVLATQTYLYLISLFHSHTGGYMIGSTVLSILFLFLAGGFIPAVFLPEAVRELGSILPGGLFLKLAGAIYH